MRLCILGPLASPHVRSRIEIFRDLGHEIHLISREHCDPAVEGCQTHFVGAQPGNRPWDLGLFYRYVSTIRQIAPDAVHVHFAQDPWGWSAALAGRRPLIVSTMGADVLFDEQGSPTELTRWLTRQVFKAADLITAKSDYMIDALEELGVPRSKCKRILWATRPQSSTSDPRYLHKALGLQESARILLSPKALQPFYRADQILHAMPSIVQRVPEAVLVLTRLFPDEDYENSLQGLVADLGLERCVRFIDPFATEQVSEVYGSIDAMISIPPSDGIPMTLLEAMSAGAPCVLADTPNLAEIVRDGDNALLTNASPGDIAAKVIAVLTDSDLAARLKRNGRQTLDALPSILDDAMFIEQEIKRLKNRRRRGLGLFGRMQLAAAIHRWHTVAFGSPQTKRLELLNYLKLSFLI